MELSAAEESIEIRQSKNSMSDTPIATFTDSDRDDLFAGWLKPLRPARPPRVTLVARIAPWRHHFTKAIEAGFTWDQLAREVATKPEIGVTVSGSHLKKCVSEAYLLAGESLDGRGQRHRRHRRKERNGAVTTGKAAGADTLNAAGTSERSLS
jgi:hypothetical protein